ncbi:hypothetical protein TSUD_215210 [Trifolium subterraneum]|uniref:Uncharacterized protein n=1 Tax=Trifolium subterraneum TaxID=3900 RepID=A0A2Z6N6I9_TRISU|nr:hypothetical protein TSUD_215210 [Trifolium subterraneum]
MVSGLKCAVSFFEYPGGSKPEKVLNMDSYYRFSEEETFVVEGHQNGLKELAQIKISIEADKEEKVATKVDWQSGLWSWNGELRNEELKEAEYFMPVEPESEEDFIAAAKHIWFTLAP